MHHRHFMLLVALAAPLGACDQSPADPADAARDLDISAYTRTFEEGFERLDVSAWGPGTKWIAHTPWHGDFGDATFEDPTPGFPFQTASGILRIEARKDADGKWRSGLISSRDHDGPGGSGFAQQYGYFEMEAMLPRGSGVWPAFWLVGITPKPRAEIDVLEYYGNAPDSYHANVHVWADDDGRYGDGKIVPIPHGSASEQFNRYGVRVEADWVTFFFNRREVWRTPTRPEFRQPMYMLANLALGSGWPIDKVPNPSFMYIKSIAAYAKRD
jgi:beta-glucanase (GH16 family)